jgi:hypothetical protein
MIHAPVAQPALQQPVQPQPAPQPVAQQPAYAVRAPMPTAPAAAPVHHPAVGDDDIPPMPAHGRMVQEAAEERRDAFLRSTQPAQPVQQPQMQQPQMQQPQMRPAPQPQPQRAARAPGSPFTAIFSRPKAQPQPQVHDEDDDSRSGVRTSQGGRGGLFDGLDDDVEIPAFLRRQSN